MSVCSLDSLIQFNWTGTNIPNKAELRAVAEIIDHWMTENLHKHLTKHYFLVSQTK